MFSGGLKDGSSRHSGRAQARRPAGLWPTFTLLACILTAVAAAEGNGPRTEQSGSEATAAKAVPDERRQQNQRKGVANENATARNVAQTDNPTPPKAEPRTGRKVPTDTSVGKQAGAQKTAGPRREGPSTGNRSAKQAARTPRPAESRTDGDDRQAATRLTQSRSDGASPEDHRATAAATSAAAAATPTGPAALRVLIDTSGSMRQNDPENLRVAGLRLLTGLLAPEIEAGVWLFGGRTEGLVRTARVDDGWKERARTLASRIHSRDARTDIEQALEAVTRDWQATPASGPRSVILLTDGVVDVAREAEKSAASRARILGPLTERLTAAGIAVHSVALSAAADGALLEALAQATGGRSLRVARAQELDRAFLHLLEGSAPRDGLPLADGRVLVDASVSELTLLVFRDRSAPPLSLTSPDGKTLTPSALPGNVRWAREPAWDMVTVRNPEPGEWRLPPGSDPDNRALIVSDLKLAIGELPPRLATGDPLPLEARLLENGEAITRDDFLDLVQVRATLEVAGAATSDEPLTRTGGAADWTGQVQLDERPGQVQLIVEAEGRTFRRQRRLPLTLATPPLAAEFAGLGADAEVFQLFLEPVAAPAREGTVMLRVATPDGAQQTLRARLSDGAATLTIPRTAPGEYRVEASIRGLDAEGLPFEQDLGPWHLHALATPPAVAAPPAPATAPPAPDAPFATDWGRVAWQVGLANLLAALLGLAVQRHFGRRASAASSAWTARIEAAMT